VASRCGLADEARESAERAAPLLRRSGMGEEADRILALTRDLSGKPCHKVSRPFDHPILGRVQLVGG
jgi:hypothetical protein